MSAMIKVVSELPLCGYENGEWILFDSKYIFQELRIDKEGKLFIRDESSHEEWNPCYDTCILRLERDSIAVSIKMIDGMLYGARIYSDFVWNKRVPVLIFEDMRSVNILISYAKLKELVGPVASGYGIPSDAKISQEGLLNIEPVYNGWILLTNKETSVPVHVLNNQIQWIGRIEDEHIVVPDTLGENQIGDDELFSSCLIKPNDYLNYGGEVKRWEHNRNDPDCSWGCKYFKPLQDEGCDWGVCTNSSSQRCGLLTFEHQAGYKCFQGKTD